jgi:hypothetical protein
MMNLKFKFDPSKNIYFLACIREGFELQLCTPPQMMSIKKFQFPNRFTFDVVLK